MIQSLNYYFHSLRLPQWIKNVFVFFPLIFSQKLNDPSAIGISISAYILFCLASSSIYLLNDIIDRERDRLHPIKRDRPIASGKVSVTSAYWIACLLACFSLSVSFFLPSRFGWIILLYLISNIFYSRIFKQLVIIDVMFLGLFFILRVLGGAVVLKVEMSYWLIICTGTLALFLGFNKRRHELYLLQGSSTGHRKVLEHYSQYFIDQMSAVLTASTVIFYTLYTVDPVTVKRFGTNLLLLTVPFVYYGVFRFLYLVHQQGQGGDPTGVVLSDRKMIINLFLWLATVVGVIYFKPLRLLFSF